MEGERIVEHRSTVRGRAMPRGGLHRHHRRRTVLVGAALLLVFASGCQPNRTSHGRYVAGTISPDGNDRYDIVDRGTGFDVTAPRSNTGHNLRRVVVSATAPSMVDQEACVTWSGPQGRIVQPGLALRVRIDERRTTAIMVSNNIVYGSRTAFNVHLADSTAKPAYTGVGSVSLPDSLGANIFAQRPLPWRMCARATGTTVRVKAWPLGDHPGEPAWSDPTYSGSVTVPMSWVRTGQPGFYVGHLLPGETTRFRNSSVTGLQRSALVAARDNAA